MPSEAPLTVEWKTLAHISSQVGVTKENRRQTKEHFVNTKRTCLQSRAGTVKHSRSQNKEQGQPQSVKGCVSLYLGILLQGIMCQ